MGFTYTDCVHMYLCDNYVPRMLDDILEVEILQNRMEDLSQVVKLDKDDYFISFV
ncbi:hypothetical protein [Sutcliffiella horikoshii]|uniref:hypothetical protein n=1 Tax=Sutcliffiella horikoshii TaxID=79883 RepID=UPI001CFDDD6A|nr:hypothetical protein [Sutcliffiella horikoshii]